MTKPVDDEMIIGASRPDLFRTEGPAAANPVKDEDEGFVLQLADLVPDVAGEVALHVTADMAVRLLSDEPLLDSGVAENHITASGVDVSGHRLYRFGNGITVYSPEALPITLI